MDSAEQILPRLEALELLPESEIPRDISKARSDVGGVVNPDMPIYRFAFVALDASPAPCDKDGLALYARSCTHPIRVWGFCE